MRGALRPWRLSMQVASRDNQGAVNVSRWIAGSKWGGAAGSPMWMRILYTAFGSSMQAMTCMPLAPQLGQRVTSSSKTRIINSAQLKRFRVFLDLACCAACWTTAPRSRAFGASTPW